LEELIDNQETESGSSVPNLLPKRDSKNDSVSSQDQQRVALSQKEHHTQLATPTTMIVDVLPSLKNGECTLCGMRVRSDDLDYHIQQFHSETWRNEAHRCPVKVCDFRSVIPEARLEHTRVHHGRDLS
ncbi:hypothetical protein PENTCL1PPCAC_4790, partial [Pristionchus entomophagus]